MNESSLRFYSAAQVRDLDAVAIGEHGIAGATLMRRAAGFAWRVLQQHWPRARHLLVLAGPGNNGGDGYDLAGIARRHGCTVAVCVVGPPVSRGDGAAAAERFWRESGQQPAQLAKALSAADLVVDAMLGTGTSRPAAGEFADAIEAVNASGKPVLALDVPSGLDADSGEPLGPCIRAQATACFVGRKFGLYTGYGPDWAGTVHFSDLGLPAAVHESAAALAEAIEPPCLFRELPSRRRAAHKGSHGQVLVIGGNHGMAGAALLSARAALRAGAGLVSVATRAEHVSALVAAQAELMPTAVSTVDELQPLLARADTVLIGPGLGRDDWARSLWAAALAAGKPMVVDADALFLLAESPRELADAVLTPHPGEAARLLDWDSTRVQARRAEAARGLNSSFGAVAVLKGAGTLVADRERLALCPRGNPGMAVGGMGDVLAGVIAALRAQGLDAETAARLGVLAHAMAGDRAAGASPRGLLPSDLLAPIRGLLNP